MFEAPKTVAFRKEHKEKYDVQTSSSEIRCAYKKHRQPQVGCRLRSHMTNSDSCTAQDNSSKENLLAPEEAGARWGRTVRADPAFVSSSVARCRSLHPSKGPAKIEDGRKVAKPHD